MIMKKTIKQIIAMICSVLCLLGILAQPAYADPIIDNGEIVGLTTDPLYLKEQQTRGQTRPATDWNINSQGQYNFSASKIYEFIYTNYRFTGKTDYTVLVKNNGTSVIDVYNRKSAFLSDVTISTKTVYPGGQFYYHISANSSDKIYLYFYNHNWYNDKSSSMSFSGYIK